MILTRFTSVYLAAKAENYPIPLGRYCAQVNALSKPKGDEQVKGDADENTIAELEFTMVQSLSFELTVHSAHRALYGLVLDIQEVDKTLTRDQITAFAAAAQQFLHVARLTDVEFIYSPTHIALASSLCISGVKPTGKELVSTWLDAKELAALPLHKEQRKERIAWREKKQAVVEERHKAQEAQKKPKNRKDAPEQAPPTPPAVEHSEAEIEAAPLGITRAELSGILAPLADTIMGFSDPAALEKGQVRPHINIDVAKVADLRVKECQMLVRASKESKCVDADSGKKRPNTSDSDADAKRARIDSDDEL